MPTVLENIKAIRSNLSDGVELIAVSKTKPNELILEAYKGGQRAFGENKVQEMVSKYESLPKDIEWHMIGHLQRNKVKYIAPFVHLIHGVDSPRLLTEINKRAQQCNRVIDVLLQIHIAQEQSKFGFNQEEVEQFLGSEEYQNMRYVNVKGLMGMATFTQDKAQVQKEFTSLKTLYDQLKNNFFSSKEDFSTVSMGMTGDYKIAEACGSTMVRIGSAIFGARN